MQNGRTNTASKLSETTNRELQAAVGRAMEPQLVVFQFTNKMF